MKYQMTIRHLAVRSAGFALVACLIGFAGGCSSSATTAALATAVGVGVGVPLATHSHVEVEVEVFNEVAPTNLAAENEGQTFEDSDSSLNQLVKECVQESNQKAFSDRMKDPLARAKYARCARTVAEKIEPSLENTRKTIKWNSDDAAAHRAEKGAQSFVDAVKQLPVDRTPTVDQVAVVESYRADVVEYFQMLSHRIRIEKNDAKTATAADEIRKEAENLGVTANPGPLAQEVTQVVLSKGKMLDAITNPKYDANWQHFSHALSDGGTGDHNAVIYFENMGFPVLKSSAFNPDKFVEAFSKTYKIAFGAIASAYGVPVGKVDDKNAISGLDPISLAARQKKAEQMSADAKKAILNALDELSQMDLTAVDATKVAKLTDLATKLENINAK